VQRAYKILSKQQFKTGEYAIVPIREEDRFSIMKWRNEQIYHLRQVKPLTEEDQNRYFNEVVSKLFDQEKPNKILFSFLKNEECVGYGGLVHINWHDKNAEISFLINTELEKAHFAEFWNTYLSLIERVAFDELSLHKIYTYAYDLRPHLYPVLEDSGFIRDAILKEHVLFDGKYLDVIIHAKLNAENILRLVTINDIEITFKWANDPLVRRFSINKNLIPWDEHKAWFERKITSQTCKYYILIHNGNPVGSVRFDLDQFQNAQISYLIDRQYHGKKLGIVLLKQGIAQIIRDENKLVGLYGYVMKENIASVKIFEKLNFANIPSDNDLLKFTKQVKNENC